MTKPGETPGITRGKTQKNRGRTRQNRGGAPYKPGERTRVKRFTEGRTRTRKNARARAKGWINENASILRAETRG